MSTPCLVRGTEYPPNASSVVSVEAVNRNTRSRPAEDVNMQGPIDHQSRLGKKQASISHKTRRRVNVTG